MNSASGTPAPHRGRRIAVLVVAMIAAAAAVGLWWWLGQRQAAPHALTLYGNVDIREVQPAFNDTGTIDKVLVEEGAAVKRGQLIATLDDRRYAAALAQAAGQMRNQQQGLAKLLAGSRPQEIAQAKATMEALRSTAQNDGVNYRRVEMLARTGAGSTQQRDDAKAAFAAATQQYEAARQAYTLAIVGPRQEDIAAARAAYEAVEAAAALARRELADTRLYAPSDGVVENRILEPGDAASPTTPVYTIALLSPLWVRAYAAETDIGKIALGMPAEVTTDSFPGQVYRGWIGFISPTAEFTPKTVETPELRTALVYQLRAYICDARGELRLGMPATVHVDLARAPAASGNAGNRGCGPADAR